MMTDVLVVMSCRKQRQTKSKEKQNYTSKSKTTQNKK